MAVRRAADQGGGMTETPSSSATGAPTAPPIGAPSETGSPGGPPPGPPPHGPAPGASGGWNVENLKDYSRLRRSRLDRKVAGVAGGLGRHLDVDPTILRVLFVVLAFFGGAGILLYGTLWLLVPEEDTEETVFATSESTRNAVLIAVAVVAALLAVGDAWTGIGFPWPLAIVGIIVVAVLASQRGRAGGPPATYPTHQAAWTQATGYQPPQPSGSTGYQPPPGYQPPSSTGYQPTPGYQPPPPTGQQPPAGYSPYPPPPHPRKGPLLFGPTLALVALALGCLGMYDALGGTVVDAAYPALALGVIGGMLVLGSVIGRPGGLVLLGLIAAVALPLTAIGAPTYDGERNLVSRPVTAETVPGEISVPSGRIVLDLTAVRDLEDLDGRTLRLDMSAGEILLIVPDDLAVSYEANIEYAGMVETPHGQRDGWGVSMNGELNQRAEHHVDVALDLRFGHIEVRQS